MGIAQYVQFVLPLGHRVPKPVYYGCSQDAYYNILAICCPQGAVIVPSLLIKTIDNP